MVHDVVDLENVGKRIRKPFCQYIATTRTVHTGALVQFTQQRLQLDLPKGTPVMVLGEGQDSIFSAGDQIVALVGFQGRGICRCHTTQLLSPFPP